MPSVSCPTCGEDEELRGRSAHDADVGRERRELTCERCGTTWDRDVVPTCGLCGSVDVQGIPTSTLQEKGRGDQWAPSGVRLAYYCWACRGADVTSSNPLPGPQPAPGGDQDLTGLRRRGR
jgi:hypothetical protein